VNDEYDPDELRTSDVIVVALLAVIALVLFVLGYRT